MESRTRRRWPRIDPRLTDAVVAVALFVASALLLVLNTMLAQPARSALGVGAVLLGAPAYYFWRMRSSRASLAHTPALQED